MRNGIEQAWKDLEGKVLHIIIKSVERFGSQLEMEFAILEVDEYTTFNTVINIEGD